jgi:hypothetical protein
VAHVGRAVSCRIGDPLKCSPNNEAAKRRSSLTGERSLTDSKRSTAGQSWRPAEGCPPWGPTISGWGQGSGWPFDRDEPTPRPGGSAAPGLP